MDLNLSWYGYNLLVTTVGAGLGWLWQHRESCRQDQDFWQGRFGRYREFHGPSCVGTPRLWFHAASVGEITGAMATIRLVRERWPSAVIWLTVGTPTGYQFAREKLGDAAEVRPFPLDFPWVIREACQYFRPDVYVALEGEFWPNLHAWLRRQNVPAVLLNGRISERSARRYRRAGRLFGPIFQHFRWLAMHSEEDRQRVIALGAAPERTLALGSAKYDALLARTVNSPVESWRTALSIASDTPVIIGGSLRRSECLELLRVFAELQEAHPRLVGLFVPRHLAQLPNMMTWLQEKGISYQFLSRVRAGEPRTSAVILVDEMGVLFDLYALGDLIFVGGTLEPIGGHNILEPAAWGRVVFYGPYLDRVRAEHHSLEISGAGIIVENSQRLLSQWQGWLTCLAELQSRGDQARIAIRRLGGVAAQQVELILNAFPATQDTPRPRIGSEV